ncbi:MAG: Gldg family protein [Byssovorax sp.]
MAVKNDREGAASSGGRLPGLDAFGPYLAPLYVLSLVLVFLGERMATSREVEMALSGLGVAGALVTTVLRFLWAPRMGGLDKAHDHGDRRSAERTLALLQVLGLVALGLYFCTTEAGKGLFGLDDADPEVRGQFETAMLVAWSILLWVALLPLLLGELALAPMRRAPQPEVRRVRAAISAAFSLAFVVISSSMFTYSAGKLDIKADFSYFRTSRPSDSTLRIAESATSKIQVSSFFPQLNEVGNEVDIYLKELAARSPNIEYKRYDRMLAPALAKDLKVTQDGVVMLVRGKVREPFDLPTDMPSAAPRLKALDIDFQRTLLKVMRETNAAYFTVDHGELGAEETTDEDRSSKKLHALIAAQNYSTDNLSLAEGLGGELPLNANLVVILGPTKPFLPEEIAALKRYRDRGGRILLALDPEAKIDHSPLAEVAGLTWSKTMIAHEKIYLRRRHNASDRGLILSNRFSSHPSVSTLGRSSGRSAVLFAGASSLNKGSDKSFKIDFVCKSLADSFADENNNYENEGTEKRGSFNLAAAVTKAVPIPPNSQQKSIPEFRAFVIADADALSDTSLGNEPNMTLSVDVIRWLGGEESYAGSMSTTGDVRIEHTRQGDQIWFYSTIIGVPALVLGIGLAMTRRARRVRRPTEKTA